jgi:hypothetical protein
MLGIFAKSAPGHWRKGPAFDSRGPAELVAHTEGRRRD